MEQLPENLVEMMNEHKGGFNNAIGLRFVKAELDEFVAELDVGEQHLQPYGLVHGGVYAGMIETLCSTGAALSVFAEGKSAVGLENSTAFLRAVRTGTLRCTARPAFKGKRSHVWEATVEDDKDRLVATGRVRMLVLEPGSEAAGMNVGLQT
jgi:1,4-dihydroxy-2-naphthoyl-CoA hydrolase